MNIHRKFHTKEEYIAYFKRLVQFCDPNVKIWRDEDLPLLEPFFKWDNREKLTDEIKQSRDFYLCCKEKYADNLFAIRDSLSNIDPESLAYNFGFTIKNTFDEGSFESDYDFELNSEITFPVFVTGCIDSDFDRFGKTSFCCINFVTQQDWNERG